MQPKTINEIVNKAIAEGKDPGQAVADLVKQEQDVKLKIRLRNNDMNLAKNIYQEKICAISTEIYIIQSECPHLETTFYSDPSGGNDSHTSCDWCGKEW